MISITFQPINKLSHNDFLSFSALNQSLICEMNTDSSISLRTQYGSKYLKIIADIADALEIWDETKEEGNILMGKIGFVLPNGAVRLPALSWIKKHKQSGQKEHLIECAPDFVVEFLTEKNSFSEMQRRLREYISNGTSVAWLIDMSGTRLYIFEGSGKEHIIDNFNKTLVFGDSDGSILRGFSFDLKKLS